jgi:putative sterol carrier protein
MTPKEIVEIEIVKKLKLSPEKASAVNAVIEIQVTGPNGGTWTIDCTKPGGEITGGSAGTSKLTVTISDADFVDMFLGKLKPQAAFLTGKVKVKGDIALALKLGNIL